MPSELDDFEGGIITDPDTGKKYQLRCPVCGEAATFGGQFGWVAACGHEGLGLPEFEEV